MPGHILLMLLIPPKDSVSGFMGYLKGEKRDDDIRAPRKSQVQVRQPALFGHWVLLGLQEEALRKYVQEQGKQDQIEDEVSGKAYENPFISAWRPSPSWQTMEFKKLTLPPGSSTLLLENR